MMTDQQSMEGSGISASDLPMVLLDQGEDDNSDDEHPQVNADMVSEMASSVEAMPSVQNTDAVPPSRFQFGTPDMANTITGWLRDLRAQEPMLNPEFNQPDLVQLEFDGVMTYAGPFEQAPLYLDGKLYGRMEQRRSAQITWSCMLYGAPEEVKPLLPYAILLGSQLREFVHDSLRHASWDFANV